MKKIFLVIIVFSIFTTFAFANYKTGEKLFVANRYQEARVAFLKTPDNFDCQYGIAVTSKFLGNFKEAIKYFNLTLKSKKNFFPSYFGLGQSYRLQGKFKTAITYYNKYLTYIKNKKVFNIVANLYIILKNYKQAKSTLEIALTYFPNSKILKQTMVKLYQKE